MAEEDRGYLGKFAGNTPIQKTFVCVKAYFNTQGVIIPETVLWEDGRRFEIDRVTDIRPAASLKAGGCGIRYTCRIKGVETYLYLDGTKWFVEKKMEAYRQG